MKEKILKSLFTLPEYHSCKFLLAVSGGVDSMVLAKIFHQLDLNFSIAHCNFNLRGEDSKTDKEFVLQNAKEFGVEFFSIDFDTKSYKEKTKLSTQMAARELRYSWFRTIKEQNSFHYIVTAHHLDDNIETIFLNLARGTGIEGITGMDLVSNFVFRPMLEVSKNEILGYAKHNKIKFREDVSNQSNSYKRNKIRNKIIPLFREINPSFVSTMGQNIFHFNTVEKIYTKAVEKQLRATITTRGSQFEIDIEKINNTEYPAQYLYEYLKRFGFNYSQVSQVILNINGGINTGAYFYSDTHKVLIDRKKIILSSNEKPKTNSCEINISDNFVTNPLPLSLKQLSKEEFEINYSPKEAFLDMEKINFPLQLRTWKEGDSFKPLGMSGRKKVSDYLIDIKLSRNQKAETYVLISKGEIVWLVGHRISEDFKISSTTKKVLNLTLK